MYEWFNTSDKKMKDPQENEAVETIEGITAAKQAYDFLT